MKRIFCVASTCLLSLSVVVGSPRSLLDGSTCIFSSSCPFLERGCGSCNTSIARNASTDGLHIANVLCNRTLTFYGDSVARQTTASIMCLMQEYYAVRNALAMIPVRDNMCRTFTTQGCYLKICFKDITKGEYDLNYPLLIKDLLKRGDASHIAVLNFGLHFFKADMYLKHLRKVFGIIRRTRLRNGKTVLWRETTAQHFPGSPDGEFTVKGHSLAVTGGCVQHVSITPFSNWRNKLANRAALLSGVRVIPTYADTSKNASSHVGGVTSTITPKILRMIRNRDIRGMGDCTHFCQPGPLDFVTYSLVETIDNINKFHERLL
mmetsp:Transcript_15641/g.26362  ORF Transcript_15641/g.26362 Transcript_15641/m.26362 type:complete len:321 (+) Transcript_15641:136-1098(+)